MNFYHWLAGNKPPDFLSKEDLVAFLFRYLDQYGDSPSDIAKAIEYALGEEPGRGGSIVVAHKDQNIEGVLVLLETGMKGYIPENILVYIAVRSENRGKGLGGQLIAFAQDQIQGGMALHVEPDNPARFLYEKMGFTNKYLEYRWQNKSNTNE
jgi:[ribosomal protein S18]-alanine N-acetyltransferase